MPRPWVDARVMGGRWGWAPVTCTPTALFSGSSTLAGEPVGLMPRMACRKLKGSCEAEPVRLRLIISRRPAALPSVGCR